jgi:hypothetical protein
MPDPTDNSVATAAQPASPAEAAATAATAPPQPPPAMSMDQPAAPPAMPGPTRSPVQYGSIPEATPDRLSPDEKLKQDSMGSKIYHGVMGALGGTQDVVQTGIDAKGNPIYSTTQMTTGMQWKKIISGALTGMSAGSQVKGPGSPMRALGAGYQAEQEQLEQQKQDKQKQVQQTFQNQQSAAKNSAEVSMMTNSTAESAFRLSREKVKASEEDIDRMNKVQGMLADAPPGSSRFLQHFANMDDVTKAFSQDPSLHDAHAQGQIVAVPHVNADGVVEGVDAAFVTKGWMDQKATKDFVFKTQRFQDGKMQDVSFTIPAGSYSNGDLMKLMMGQAKDSMEAHWKQVETQSKVKLEAGQTAESYGKAAEANANAQQKNAMPLGTATGEEFLQTMPAGIRTLIKATANGDIAIPPAGTRNPQAQMLRTSVMQYDPTFTDARYKAKQTFKGGSDAQNVVQLSTAMEHAERATTNSAAAGTAPFLGQKNFESDASARYMQDVQFLTGEVGKLVKNGMLTEEEGRNISNGLTSARQDVRDTSLHETMDLLGGKSRAVFQKYKTATGQDLPLDEFFDQDTQKRLLRYGIVAPGAAPGAPGAAPGAPGAAPGAAAAAPPRNAAVTPPKPAPTLSQVPAGAQPGYDKKTGALLGYQDSGGWHPL